MELLPRVRLAVYFTTRCLLQAEREKNLSHILRYFQTYGCCDKVYLESYRDGRALDDTVLRAAKSFFEENGVKTAGALTATCLHRRKTRPLLEEDGVYGSGGVVQPEEWDGWQKGEVWQPSTLCYSDPQALSSLQQAAEQAARLFDEVILDDFFSTSCTCPRCIQRRGDQSWEQARREWMQQAAKEYVLSPMKRINPRVQVVIKFPNWSESYKACGYDPLEESALFDGIYTGAETRNPGYSPQCLPPYAGYGLTRWLSHMAPGKNGGAWIDPLDCEENIGYFLQQALLPILAGAKELTLFCAGWLYQTPFIPALGHTLQHGPVSAFGGQPETRLPGSIAAYEPPRSAPGEEHLSDILGMVGLPLERTPFFPKTGGCVLLTRGAACDPTWPDKVRDHLQKGGTVCLTSGLLQATDEKKWGDLTTARVMPGRVTADRYTLWSGSHQIDHRFFQGGEITVPVLSFATAATECVASLTRGETHVPLLLQNMYAAGTVLVLAVPDCLTDLYRIPGAVLTAWRQRLGMEEGLYLEGESRVSLFPAVNGDWVIFSFLPYSSRVRLHVAGEYRALRDRQTGEILRPLWQNERETVFDIPIKPVLYRAFSLEKEEGGLL